MNRKKDIFSIEQMDNYLKLIPKLTDQLIYRKKLIAERNKQIIINHIYPNIKEVTKWEWLETFSTNSVRNLILYLWRKPLIWLRCKHRLLKNSIRKLRKIQYFPELRLRDLLFRRRIKILSRDTTLTVLRRSCVRQLLIKEKSTHLETLPQFGLDGIFPGKQCR